MSTRILYLDDEEPLVFIVKRMLKHLGHEPSCFSRADEALAAYSAAPDEFDLVLTDMAMPGMSGVDFATEVFEAASAGARVHRDRLCRSRKTWIARSPSA